MPSDPSKSTRKKYLEEKQSEKHFQTAGRIQSMKSRLSEPKLTGSDGVMVASTSNTVAIHTLNVEQLREKLDSKTLTPMQILRAFQKRCLTLYQEGNSGICEFVREVSDEVTKTMTSSSSEERADLWGIPVSVKELLPIQGYDCTMGLLKLCNQPAKEDCVLVQTLRAEGAMPFVLTASTQYARVPLGFNPVVGQMHHPWRENYEPGGSSCGEAILLSKMGSVIGFGTDIGGSVRIPAAFCGLVALRPTSNRLSTKGMVNYDPHSVLLIAHVPGPMARETATLVSAMRTLLRPTMFRLDPSIPPLRFQESSYDAEGKKLTIAYYETLEDENLMQTVPSVRNAVRRVVEALRQRGHMLVQFKPPRPFDAFQLALRALSIDSGRSMRRDLFNESLGPYLKEICDTSRLPKWRQCLADKQSNSKDGPPAALAKFLSGPRKVEEVMELLNDMLTYRKEFEQALRDAGDADLLLGPTWPYPAFRKGTSSAFLHRAQVYTILYNLLDYPAGTVPGGCVTDADLEQTKAEANKLRNDGDRYHAQLFDLQSDTLGLTTGIQVIGKPYREEVVLRLMQEIESIASTTDES